MCPSNLYCNYVSFSTWISGLCANKCLFWDLVIFKTFGCPEQRPASSQVSFSELWKQQQRGIPMLLFYVIYIWICLKATMQKPENKSITARILVLFRLNLSPIYFLPNKTKVCKLSETRMRLNSRFANGVGKCNSDLKQANIFSTWEISILITRLIRTFCSVQQHLMKLILSTHSEVYQHVCMADIENCLVICWVCTAYLFNIFVVQFAEQEAHIIGMSSNLAGVYVPGVTKQDLWFTPLSDEEEVTGNSHSSSSETLTFSTPEVKLLWSWTPPLRFGPSFVLFCASSSLPPPLAGFLPIAIRSHYIIGVWQILLSRVTYNKVQSAISSAQTTTKIKAWAYLINLTMEYIEYSFYTAQRYRMINIYVGIINGLHSQTKIAKIPS